MSTLNGLPHDTVDFDLHGFVRVRLRGASDRETAIVTRQLGPLRVEPVGDADIVIRFVSEVARQDHVRLLGVDDAGFTADEFLILRGKQKTRVRVRLPFEDVGGPSCELQCERGLPAVPQLIPLLNITALSRGLVPMHASAFVYRGVGVLATGWAKGGKTETLLAFMAKGAEYVGDEWIYLTPDGHMLGIPEPIRMWDWQLAQSPSFRRAVRPKDRVRLRALRGLVRTLEALERGPRGAARLSRRALPIVERQQYVHMPPGRMFGNGVGTMRAPLDKVFLVASGETSAVSIAPVDVASVAERMVFSLVEERKDFLSYYHKFRFAFPDRPNPFIERSEALQRDLLAKALADTGAYEVLHPYPVTIPDLFDAIAPFLEDRRSPNDGRSAENHQPVGEP